ncbi:MAG TPA: hypothetical protein VLL08_05055 [Kineosporiaceae bacterium]|nr:hypothetical protein [Kineosporiaceae bacterium]
MTTTSPASRPRCTPTAEQILPFRTEGCPAEAEQLLKQGLVRRVISDVLVAFDAPDSWEIRASAASLLIPAEIRASAGWVVGFGSAAWLHTGFGSTEPHPPAELQVIVPPGRRRPKRPGVRGRQVALAPDQVVFLGSAPVTDPVRTAADVARDLPADQAVAALHRLGELCGVRPQQVLQVLATMRYARGAATARQVVRTWTEE